MYPELRLVRYFLAVAAEGNITRAAERLHISQPSLSAALKQLEAQLGVALLERRGRGVALTASGALLQDRGTALMSHYDTVLAEVRGRGDTPSGRLQLGLSPSARHAIGPAFLEACTQAAPAVMLYTSEATTGELLRDVSTGKLDLAITFCAPTSLPPGVELLLLREDPASVHMAAEHPLAGRTSVTLADLAEETIIVAGLAESAGFTERVLAAFAAEGISPPTVADPYPDLGLQSSRERLGVTVDARSAFPPELEGWAFVPIDPPVLLPYHVAWHTRSRTAPLGLVLRAARDLATLWPAGRG